jgi:non-specific protein-tyrosine kinase
MELRQYIAIFARWWWLIIVIPIVTAGVGYEISQRLPRVYQATTTVMVGKTIQATSLSELNFETGEQLAQTYKDIAFRQPVLQGVVDTLALNTTWQALKEQIHVSVVPETQLLEISAEAHSPALARIITDEVARQLILLSSSAKQDPESEEKQRFARERLKSLQSKIEAGQAKVKKLEATISTTSLSTERIQAIQQQINTMEALITDWENNFTQLLFLTENKNSPNYLTVIEPAQVDPEATSPYVLLNIFLAGMVGLCLATGLVFLLEYFDETFKTTDDISKFLGMTVLGAIGRVKGKDYLNKLISSESPISLMRETFRMIRSSIQFLSVNRQVKSILVTSSLPGEGKSLIAANLGVTMAQAGLRTIVVDNDLRRPVLHQIFQVVNDEGLTDLLFDPELKINDYLKETEIKNLQLLTSGSTPPEASDLLGSERMKQVISYLNEIADIIIYDSPPVLAVTDATVLANQVDGVVFVVRAGKTMHSAARCGISNLKQADANILGVILNRISNRSWGFYYRRYYYARNQRNSAASQSISSSKVINNSAQFLMRLKNR